MTYEQASDIPIDLTEEAEEDEQDIITYQISYYPADFTLKGYFDKWEANQLIIPSFQRNYVWDQVQASKLIESFLLGLPVPGVFLYKDRRTNKLDVIDGQQRILSVIRYFQGRFDEKVFRLKNVHPRWDGKTFEELPEADRLQLQDAVLRATVVQQLDPQDNSSVYHIFERLNTGGLKLSPMEIRKCVYHGEFYQLLENLNLHATWRQIIGSPRPDRRLKDIEFLLRVLALAENWEVYDKPMKAFLNGYMVTFRSGNTESSPEFLRESQSRFTKACDMVIEALGDTPFHLRGRLNLAVLDSVMSVFFEGTLPDPDELKRRFDALVLQDDYLEAVSHNTSDRSAVTARFQAARNVLLAGH